MINGSGGERLTHLVHEARPRMAKRNNNPDVATSISDLARQVGRSEGAIRKWRERDDWPFGQKAPYNVPDVKAWMAVLSEDPGAQTKAEQEISLDQADTYTKARIMAAIERAKLTRIKRQREEGKLIEFEKAAQLWLRDVNRAKSALLAIPTAIADRLSPATKKSRRHVVAVAEEAIRSALNNLSEGYTAEDVNDSD